MQVFQIHKLKPFAVLLSMMPYGTVRTVTNLSLNELLSKRSFVHSCCGERDMYVVLTIHVVKCKPVIIPLLAKCYLNTVFLK